MTDIEPVPVKETKLPDGFTVNKYIASSPEVRTSKSATLLRDRTVDDVILEWTDRGENFERIATFDIAKGTVLVNGQQIELESKPFNHSGTTYVDGAVYSLEDALILLQGPQYDTLRYNFSVNQYPAVVQMKSGNFYPFYEDRGDSVVLLQKLREQKGRPKK